MLRIVLPLLLLAAPASAHTVGGTGFIAGLAHPLFGVDHLLAMVAVGLWAGRIGGRGLWVVPSAFVAAMLLGSLVPVALPMIEIGILGSVLILGLLAFWAPKLPLWAPATLVALFAVLHGHAHGIELAGGAATLGFVIATAALHALGAVLPHARWFGLGVATAGMLIAVA